MVTASTAAAEEAVPSPPAAPSPSPQAAAPAPAGAQPAVDLAASPAGEQPEQARFLIRPYVGMTSLDVTLTSDSGKEVDLKPNMPFFTGLKLGYKGYSISGSARVSSVDDEATHGKSDSFDIQVGKAIRVKEHDLLLEGFLQRYHGYFIENTKDLDSAATGHMLRPDLSSYTFGVSGLLYLNRAFSHDATFGDFLPRKSSGGSWFLRASLGMQGMSSDDDTPFLPLAARADFGKGATMHAFGSGFVSASAGYAYDWRFLRRFLLAGAIGGGFSAARSSYRLTETNDINETAVGVTVSLFMAFAYVGDTFHAGVVVAGNLESMKASTIDMGFMRMQVLEFVGMRF